MFSLVLLLFALSISVQAQYLKVADKSECEKYLAFCNDSMTVNIIQYGKVTIPMQYVPGLDFEMAKMIPGTFTDLAVKPDTFWYQAWRQGLKATKYTIDYNQQRVTRIIKVKVQRRIPSVKDFYLNWKTGLIKIQ